MAGRSGMGEIDGEIEGLWRCGGEIVWSNDEARCLNVPNSDVKDGLRTIWTFVIELIGG